MQWSVLNTGLANAYKIMDIIIVNCGQALAWVIVVICRNSLIGSRGRGIVDDMMRNTAKATAGCRNGRQSAGTVGKKGSIYVYLYQSVLRLESVCSYVIVRTRPIYYSWLETGRIGGSRTTVKGQRGWGHSKVRVDVDLPPLWMFVFECVSNSCTICYRMPCD